MVRVSRVVSARLTAPAVAWWRFRMVEWVRYGPSAVLLRFADVVGEASFRQCRAILAELERNPPAGLIECVPGFTTLLLRFDPTQRENLPWLGRYIADQVSALSLDAVPEPPVKSIPVVYDGEDLAGLAAEKKLTPTEVIKLHCEPVYLVHLLGFSPGFPYLGGLHPRLHTPRRATPRPRVPAGSVAIGGEHTGIYSVDSPGGWHLIGRTEVRLFAHDDLAADTVPREVFLLQPGDRVKFVPVEAGQL